METKKREQMAFAKQITQQVNGTIAQLSGFPKVVVNQTHCPNSALNANSNGETRNSRRTQKEYIPVKINLTNAVPPKCVRNQAACHQITCDQNILQSAKNLFAKCTRTLCNWMNPNCRKRQIQQALDAAWDSLDFEMKKIYIMGVSNACNGITKSHLFVNPAINNLLAMPEVKLQPNGRGRRPKLVPAAPEVKVENPPVKAKKEEPLVQKQVRKKFIKVSLSKLKRPETVGMAETVKRLNEQRMNEMFPPMTLSKRIKLEEAEKDFADDPELRDELIKFILHYEN